MQLIKLVPGLSEWLFFFNYLVNISKKKKAIRLPSKLFKKTSS